MLICLISVHVYIVWWSISDASKPRELNTTPERVVNVHICLFLYTNSLLYKTKDMTTLVPNDRIILINNVMTLSDMLALWATSAHSFE